MSRADDTDPASPAAASTRQLPSAIGWPLVDRRLPADDGAQIGSLELVPENPVRAIRVIALAIALHRGRDLFDPADVPGIVALLVTAGLTAWFCVLPVPTRRGGRHPRRSVLFRVALEHLLLAAALGWSGLWGSPVAVMVLPAGIVAGLALGVQRALLVGAVMATIVSAAQVAVDPTAVGVEQSLSWSALLLLVTFLGGLVRHAGLDAGRQRAQALARVSQLAEANSLLFALQRVTQTLPSSLDLDEVVDSTLQQIEAVVPADTVALYLASGSDPSLDRFRVRGRTVPDSIDATRAPATVRTALEAPRTVLLARLDPSVALSAGATSALYTALRARGNLVGLLVVESSQSAALDAQHAEVVHGLAEPFGMAIDNARLFRRIRAASADEERSRIARDLHDRVGSSLAFLGFEFDRARARAGHDEAMDSVLDELRGHLTSVVRDVRETLHDLRTDITEEQSLGAVMRMHLDRVEERSDVAVRLEVVVDERPAVEIERELWRIALEALTNVERHADADVVSVVYRADSRHILLEIRDDGVGFNSSSRRADSYGMTGMRERADMIGASLRVDASPSGGTAVTVAIDLAARGEP